MNKNLMDIELVNLSELENWEKKLIIIRMHNEIAVNDKRYLKDMSREIGLIIFDFMPKTIKLEHRNMFVRSCTLSIMDKILK